MKLAEANPTAGAETGIETASATTRTAGADDRMSNDNCAPVRAIVGFGQKLEPPLEPPMKVGVLVASLRLRLALVKLQCTKDRQLSPVSRRRLSVCSGPAR